MSGIKIVERKDGKTVTMQAHIYAIPLGKVKAERFRFKVPVGITSKSAAERWATQVRRDIEAGRPPPQSRAGREQVAAVKAEQAKAAELAARESKTIAEWVQEYLSDCDARRVRPTTIKLRRTQLQHLLAVAATRPVRDFGELDWAKLRRQIAKLAPSTANWILGLVAQVLRAAHRRGLRDPVPSPLKVIEPESEPEAYSLEEFERLVSAAEHLGDQHLAVELLGGDAGLRRGEMAGLRVEDIARDGTLHIRRTIVVHDGQRLEHPPKGGKTRRVPSSPRLAAVLRRLAVATGDGWLLHTPTGEPGVPNTIQRLAYATCTAAGLPTEGPHKRRHTYATHQLEAGATLKELKELLGHADITTTERYTHTTESKKRSAIERLVQYREAQAADTAVARNADTTRAAPAKSRNR